jgi:hypothetical protein
MVSDTIKIEDAAYWSAFGEESGLTWSQAQVNQGFKVKSTDLYLGVKFEVSISIFSKWIPL